MPEPGYLLPAYGVNIAMLVPVCWWMFARSRTRGVFQGRVEESEGLRKLVGSLWLAILAASIAGLAWPAFFLPILLAQVVYKTVWLATFAGPRLASGRAREIPAGISLSFLFIVVTYPALIWMALAGSQGGGTLAAPSSHALGGSAQLFLALPSLI